MGSGPPSSVPLLEVSGLSVRFPSRAGAVEAVSDLTFSIRAGETLAIVGESGSGKSTAGLAIMGFHADGGTARVEGAIRLATKSGEIRDIVRATARERRRLRGNDVTMIFQEPMSSLNPVYAIGSQIVEAMTEHRRISSTEAMIEARRLLEFLAIPSPERVLASYPHQLSGGMRQRVMIAIAISCRPQLLIADEPTTALDVTVQAQVLDLLRRLKAETGMAILFITHNLGVVAEMADRLIVMYGGRMVESGPVRSVFRAPRMPYTQALLRSLPRLEAPRRDGPPLHAIAGQVPSAVALPPGCAFHPRCAHHVAGACDASRPALEAVEPDHHVRCLRWRDIGEGRGRV